MAKYVEEFTAMTLRELMQEKPLDQIKVKDIIERGGINRKTFYYHFHGMEDLLKWMVSKALDGLPTDETTFANWDEQVMALIRLMEKHKAFLLQLSASRYAPVIRSYVYDRLRRYYENFVSNAAALYETKGQGPVPMTDADIRRIANYYLYAVMMSIVEEWLNTGCQESCEQIQDNLIKLTKSLIFIFRELGAFYRDMNAE